MSQNQQNLPCLGPPKKFLKKGEGLKRFAAYKPPLPNCSGIKIQRRQTFVKFKADHDITARHDNFLHPDILRKDVNLSKEIPTIAPPKIKYTPIKPNRQALGMLKTPNFNSNNNDLGFSKYYETISTPDPKPLVTREKQHQTQDHVQRTSPDHHIEASNSEVPRRYNLRGSRKTATISATEQAPKKTKETRRTRRQIKAVVERHISPYHSPNVEAAAGKGNVGQIVESTSNELNINENIDNLLKKIEEKKSCLEDEEEEEKEKEPGEKDSDEDVTGGGPRANSITPSLKVNRAFDLSSPTPGSCILALGRQIQHIQSTVNELKDKFKNCECGASSKRRLDGPDAGNCKQQQRKTTRAKATEKTRPSADADNNSTPRLVTYLVHEIAQLKEEFDHIKLKL